MLRTPKAFSGPGQKPRWMDAEECAQATPSDSEAIFSAFAAFQDKMRSFRDSRIVESSTMPNSTLEVFTLFPCSRESRRVKERRVNQRVFKHLHRAPHWHNFQKGMGSSGSTQRPGHPEYRGCFICGSKDHDFRDCPNRRTDAPSTNSSSTRPNYFSNQIFVVLPVEENEPEAMTATEDTTAAPWQSSFLATQ